MATRRIDMDGATLTGTTDLTQALAARASATAEEND